MKKLTYLHGLGGSFSNDRDRVFKKFGYDFYYPTIDYKENWNLDRCRSLVETITKYSEDSDIIIGISIGGYLAHIVANLLGKDCLIINPALNRDLSRTDIKWFDTKHIYNNSNLEIYLGDMDSVIPNENTINFVKDLDINSNINIISGMGHRCSDTNLIKILKSSKLL
jgi:predicted esterase YcpF (UPF0227 family)